MQADLHRHSELNVSARHITRFLLVLTIAGCAHAGSSGADSPASARADIGPRIVQQQSRLRFRTDPEVRFRGIVEVTVDENGRPDLFRLRTVPKMDENMRRDVEEWLQGVVFFPAQRDGEPVTGVFKMRFK